MQRIGILGGSFDPVHFGHLRIAESFLRSGLIEKLLVIPAPTPPHKAEIRTDFTHRIEMLKLAFQDWDGVEISDLEMKLPAPSYTVQTIQYLQQENPENIYFLCLGEDSLIHFHTWHRYKEIIEKVPLLVAERPGFDSSLVDQQLLENAVFVDHTPYDVSSSEIRETKESRNELKSILKSVKEYIETHNLYSNIGKGIDQNS